MKLFKSYSFFKRIVIDAVFVIFLIAFSLFLNAFYFNAQLINTTYSDWMIHAFRVKILQDFGLVSWTHIWGNGISLWKAYQFIPHFITLLIVYLFKVSITRAMVLLTIGLFIFLRLSIYFVLRLLKFSPTVSFIASLLSCDIAQYYGGVSDYSLMFGFAFFPWIIYLWVLYTKNKLDNFFPYIAGFSFYIHPLLGLVSFALWLMGIISSSKKIISLAVIKQFLILLASASLFWFPIVVRTSFLYSAENTSNLYFLNLVLSSYNFYGLSFFILSALFIGIFFSFFPLIGNRIWLRILGIFFLTYFVFIFVGTKITLPHILEELQFTRGVTFIGIGAIFLFAPIIEYLVNLKSFLIWTFGLFFLGIILVENIWFASIYSPSPGNSFEDPVSYFITSNPKNPLAHNLAEQRIWSPSIDLASYYGPTTIRLLYSYMQHLDSNQITPRIIKIILYSGAVNILPPENIERINNYFKITGVKYAIFDQFSPFTTTFLLQKANYKDLGKIDMPNSLYHLFQVAWTPRNAVLVNPNFKNNLGHFPFNLVLEKPNDQTILDRLVKNFTDIIYSSKNTPLIITYPTQETMSVSIPKIRNSNLVFINESYDTDWKASFNGKNEKIQSSGPNYMLITLNEKNGGGTLFLKHSWPLSFYLSWILIIILPIYFIIQKLNFKKIKEGINKWK